jgi:DnaK suppressor protein
MRFSGMPTRLLSAAQTALRNQLLAQRTELLARIAHERGGVIGRAEVASDQYETAASDNAQLRSEREAQFAMNEHETAELDEIERALNHIAQGDYGSCIDCAVTIPQARLVATPTALRCIGCQSAHEAQHPHS